MRSGRQNPSESGSWSKFLVPSPSNLHVWGKTDSPTPPLCSRRGSLDHVLRCCPTALGEDLYQWLHDQVLKSIAEAVFKGMSNIKQVARRTNITFVSAGEQPQLQFKPAAGLFTTALDMELHVDLRRELKFPEHVVATSLRPDVGSNINLHKAVAFDRADSPLGGPYGGGERTKADHVPGVVGAILEGWLEGSL